MDAFLQFVMERVAPGLNLGLLVSLKLIIPASCLGVIFGVITGTVRVYGPRPVRWLADSYVTLFRGTPLVVQLYFWYFALPYFNIGSFRIVLDPVEASIIGFFMCSAAYQSEYVRMGLMSIKAGQIKAAQALGMTPFQTIVNVVLPQAVRRALPGCGNEIIYLIKYSSLASIITVNELTGAGREIAKATWRNIEVFSVVGLYYLLIVTVATWILKKIEEKTAIPGFNKSRE
ncbi:amino acid ABC transporter permease [Desulfobaculum bizertense]|uniref:Amino acid ABC transporter membrane protein 2, PAAT family (TC 3.A.1.3.-) n=1 Tax=Desulfobaculum bizertense DSM 18034 TaxID=1121442 RepID=A0A1T4X176_9BACT|nr:amino acid ABC transporter permease [Desulfobaculum bizertense]UIJ37353.1 amino acid ABC transporter permease [Desulfobaculum bizertense]SKA82815.1 amino acid ABC transporter membrane protein 2, PAAT family (TC 3.A.1.3.-) [Desulfobaculum bizertense DSM 18034]